MINNPKVSVTVMTYNQKDYIGQCLESLVTQECDFKYEIIVGDDASTDGTSDIVREYANKYPDIIVPLIHEKNLGPSGNFFAIVELAKGDYIAHMDGDDYALPGKLQAQADFIDKTPDCNICFHRVKALFPDGTIKDDLIDYEKIKDGFERKDLLMYMAVAANSSKMYRKEVKYFDVPNFDLLDTYANIEQVKDKKAYFVSDKIYGVYRTNVGISTNRRLATEIAIYKSLILFSKKYRSERKYINSAFLVLFLADLKNGRNFLLHIKGWLKTFCFSSIFLTIKTWKIRRMFKRP